jgi:hypothetical protein
MFSTAVWTLSWRHLHPLLALTVCYLITTYLAFQEISLHYTNTVLDIVHCLRCIWYTRRFGIWLYSRLQVNTSIRKIPGSIPTVVIISTEGGKSVSKMTTNHLKTAVEPNPETSCISNIPQVVDDARYSVSIINQPLSQTFRESLGFLTWILCVHLYHPAQHFFVIYISNVEPARELLDHWILSVVLPKLE